MRLSKHAKNLRWLLVLPSLSAAAPLKLEVLTSDLDRPWGMAVLPDQSLLITERSGVMRRFFNNTLSLPISGLPAVYDAGQGGLLDVLVAPDFADSKTVWVSYASGTKAANHTAVSELKLDISSSRLQVIASRLLFETRPAKDTSVHYGGRIAHWQGSLLLTTGDGFDYREQAQNPASQLGKTVRIDLKTGASQIYTLGHRNPQGLVWDAQDNRLWLHEHGPQGGDELNLLKAGENYGWPAISGGLDYSGAQVSPFAEYPGFANAKHVWTPSIAPSGMVLYQGAMFPKWQGSLLITSLAAQKVYRLTLEGPEVTSEEILDIERNRYRDAEIASDGSVYLLGDGKQAKLWKLRSH